MDAAKVSAAIRDFAEQHATVLADIGNRQTQLLEIGANVAVVQHYRAQGYITTIVNPVGVSEFKVKLGTRGHPADYSRVICQRGEVICEIHSNLSVEGGRRDHGVYCVDVAVVKPDRVPATKTKTKPPALGNDALISFAEAKKLVVYPMLLAHFIGIVHEVAPQYMRRYRRESVPDDHLQPTLITLGHLTKNAETIEKSFRRRKYKVWIAQSFDLRLFYARRNPALSPFLQYADLKKRSEMVEDTVREVGSKNSDLVLGLDGISRHGD